MKEVLHVRKGIYPGSFDPVTYGHLDIIERGSKMFDHLYVAVTSSVNKNCVFTLEERLELLKEVCKKFSNVEVITCSGTLLVNFAKKLGAYTILRGLRVVTDFEYELQMAATNKSLDHEIETVFMMTSPSFSFLSSSTVKEIASFAGDNTQFVPKIVSEALEKKFRK